MKKNKYRAVKATVDGLLFDSKKEYERYIELKNDKNVTDLQTQVKYRIDINGVHICKYIADFVYMRNGALVVEDVKGDYTRKLPVYRLKRKMMLAVHGVVISEY